MRKPIFHALAFLLLTAPIYLSSAFLPVGHPLVWVAILLFVTWLFLKREGRTLAVLGLNPAWRRLAELIAGIALGTLLILLVALCVRLFLPFKWSWNAAFRWDAAAFSLLYFLSGNAVEELLFRGYSFERLIAGLGLWKAQVATALLFAVFHMVNGWPWQIALTGTTVGSLLFGMVFIRWRSVPAAIGVHAAANWTRDFLLTDPPGLQTLYAPLSTRPWTTGERVSAVLFMDAICLLATFAIWYSGLRGKSPAPSPKTQLTTVSPSP